MSPPASRSGTRPARASNNVFQDILVSEFLLAESPKLLEMYRSGQGKDEIGPIPRCARMFGVVVGFLKLRWMLKLHYALVSLAGNRCSLERLLVGTLTSVCNNHQYPQSPLEIFELVVATLQTRFQQGWPLLLAYIGAHDLDGHHDNMHIDSTFGPRPFTAPHNTSARGQPAPYQPVYHPKAFMGKDTQDKTAFLWQVVDDMMISWVVQQDPILFPAESIWQELDFYGVPRPAVRTNLEGLSSWMKARASLGANSYHMRPAQRQAHHLALTLELAQLRSQNSASDEELLEMGRDIVSHPRTFNSGVRVRIASVLQGRYELASLGIPHTSSIDMDEDQLRLYLSHTADPQDSGRLDSGMLDKLTHVSLPWLTGREPRFKAAANSWPEPAPRPPYLAEFDDYLPPNSARSMQSMSNMMSYDPFEPWEKSVAGNVPSMPIWR